MDSACLSGIARMLILLLSGSRDTANARAILAKPALERACDFHTASLEHHREAFAAMALRAHRRAGRRQRSAGRPNSPPSFGRCFAGTRSGAVSGVASPVPRIHAAAWLLLRYRAGGPPGIRPAKPLSQCKEIDNTFLGPQPSAVDKERK